MIEYKVFETERLLIKPTTEDDKDLVFNLLNTPDWILNIGDRDVHSIESAAIYIKERILPQLNQLGFSNYTVIRKLDNVKIGSCGLYDREGIDGIDIGFAFLPQYCQKGYAFEASERIKQAAFEEFKLHELKAITKKNNIASKKLIEKMGLKYASTITLPNETEEWMLYKIDAATNNK